MGDPSTRFRHSGQRLPSGTVTFLFTDIEGNTNLAQPHREAREAGLEMIIDEAIGLALKMVEEIE